MKIDMTYDTENNPLIKQMKDSMVMWQNYHDKYFGEPEKFIKENQRLVDQYLSATKTMLAYMGYDFNEKKK